MRGGVALAPLGVRLIEFTDRNILKIIVKFGYLYGQKPSILKTDTVCSVLKNFPVVILPLFSFLQTWMSSMLCSSKNTAFSAGLTQGRNKFRPPISYWSCDVSLSFRTPCYKMQVCGILWFMISVHPRLVYLSEPGCFSNATVRLLALFPGGTVFSLPNSVLLWGESSP